MPLLTDKNAIALPDLLDVVHVVDVSDTSGNAAGTSKKMTLAQLQSLMLSELILTFAAIGNTVTDTDIIQIALTGTGDSLLPPPIVAQPIVGGNYNGYERVAALSMIAESGSLTVVGAALTIGAGGDGSYHTPHAWVDMSSNSTATTVGFVFGIVKASDGLVRFSQRVTGARMAAQDDRTNTSGGGFVAGLEEGDTLSMWVAADKTATITIYDANIGLKMLVPATLTP